MKKIPTVLLIMDGFGLAPADAGNAIAAASTPELDALFAACPHTRLEASGEAVGLPAGQIGNSEVGHTNIGAGRVVYQDLPRISNAIADGRIDVESIVSHRFTFDDTINAFATCHKDIRNVVKGVIEY